MIGRVNYGGLVIAGVGFFLTRFTVTLAVSGDPMAFYFTGVVPLALGLGLSAFGVALTVADVDAATVRTAAVWCVVGLVTMLALVVLTLLGSPAGDAGWLGLVQSRASFSNFLIGGSVGGTLTGLYAARARQRRGALRRQTHRLEVLNRLLRHEVLNAVAIIRGYATLDDDPEAASVIERHADSIERAIEEVRHLTRSADADRTAGSVSLAACLATGVDTVRERHADATVSVPEMPAELTVRANDRLERVFTHLLDNAVVHTGDGAASVEVSVETTPSTARVSVRDEGPGLPERQQALLESGDISEYDDPNAGFGLHVVRLLVESYGGTIELDVDDAGTTVTVVLRRADVPATGVDGLAAGGGAGTAGGPVSGVRPAVPHLAVTLVVGVLAGVVYGAAAFLQGGSIAAIGVFYGIANPLVGWYTHEFHSVVFAFAFAVIVSRLPARYRNHAPAYVAVGAAWGTTLWIVAAGIVAPVWLRLLGVPAPLPNLSVPLFVNHLLWGGTLGAATAWGYARLEGREST